MKATRQTLELQKIFSKMNTLKGLLLSLDGYDRWGHGSDAEKAAASAEADRADKELKELESALKTRVSELRASDPKIVLEWAQAHLALLNEFMGRMQIDAEKNGTEIYVAKEEIEMWNKVIAGGLDFADQNVFYIHYSPELYAEYFG